MKFKELYQKNKEKYLQLFGKSIFHDLLSLFFGVTSLIIALALFLIIAFRLKAGDFLIPLVYNSIYGVTSLGAWYKIYLYPITFVGFTIINFLIAWAYFDRERLISYLALFINIIIGILLVIIEFNLTAIIRG